LSFKICKPRHRLKERDVDKTQPQLAEEVIRELLRFGFRFPLVLADSLYGESGIGNWSFRRAKVKFYCGDLESSWSPNRSKTARTLQQLACLPTELISEANQKDVRFGKLFLASGAASAQSEITNSDPKNSKADT